MRGTAPGRRDRDPEAVRTTNDVRHRLPASLIASAVLAALLPGMALAQTVNLEVLAITGDSLPEGIIDNLNFPTIVSRNLVVAQANFETDAFDDPSAVLLDRSGVLSTVLIEPHQLPGGQEELGQLNFNGISVPLLNSSGEILFPGEIKPVGACCPDEAWLLFDSTDGSLREVVRDGDVAPDGNGFLFVNQNHKPAFNEVGQVAFWASVSGAVGGLGNGSGLFRDDGGALTRIVRRGQVPPDGSSFFDGFSWPSMNGLGDVAFIGFTDSNEEGVYLGSGGSLVEITRTGRTVPPGWEVVDLSPVEGVPVNNSKQVAFRAEVDTGATCCGRAIYLSDGTTTELLASGGQPLERSTGTVPLNIGSNLALNNEGQVAFTADDIQGNSGIFRVDSESLVTIAVGGDTVPGTANSPFVDLHGFPFAVNDNGDVAFMARFDDGQEFQDGLFYFSNATGLLPPLVQEGGPLAGGIVERLEFVGTSPAALRSGQPSGLDRDGDVTFFFALEDGREGIARVEVCEVLDNVDLFDASIAGAEEHRACNRITVADVAVLAGGDLRLQAGEAVELHDGFSVAAGGSLRVLIDIP